MQILSRFACFSRPATELIEYLQVAAACCPKNLSNLEVTLKTLKFRPEVKQVKTTTEQVLNKSETSLEQVLTKLKTHLNHKYRKPSKMSGTSPENVQEMSGQCPENV